MKKRLSHRQEIKSRRGFTLVELLVVIAIIGTLIGLLLPAVQSARESANRSKCSNNMRQAGLAAQNYADAYSGNLPNSHRPNNGTARIAWITRVLPFIEQKPLYDRWDMAKNWSDTTSGSTAATSIPNAILAMTRIESLQCPSAPSNRWDGDPDTGSTPSGYPTTNTTAVANTAGTAFTTVGLFCAPTDYSPTIFVDQRLDDAGTPADNKADVAHNQAQGAQKASPADGMLPKDYNGTNFPKMSDVTDGLSNTILLCESAGRPFQFINGKRADDPSASSFPTKRINGGGWCRPASDFAFDGATKDGLTFGTGATHAVNVTNGESVETGTYKGAIYGTEGTSEPYAFHPGGVQVAFGDGSVRLINKDVTIRVFSSLVTRAGAEQIDRKSAGL